MENVNTPAVPLRPDPVAQMRDLVEEVRTEDRRHWTAGARSARLRELLELRDRLEAAVLSAMAEWDAGHDWAPDGSLNPAAWLGHQTSTTAREARRLVSRSRFVAKHERSAAALAEGEIPAAHVDVMAQASAGDRAGVFVEHEEVLLNAAEDLSPNDFAKAAAHWRRLADGQLAHREAGELYEARSFHASTSFKGMVLFNGALPAEEGATLLAALEDHMTPDPEGSPEPRRTPGQRRADALVALADAWLNKKNASGTANVNVVIDYQTLTGGDCDPNTSRSEIVGVGPVARATVERLMCDSALTRVVMNGPSQVLDVGRRTRFVTPPQRTALVVRRRRLRVPVLRPHPRVV